MEFVSSTIYLVGGGGGPASGVSISQSPVRLVEVLQAKLPYYKNS